MFEDGAGMKRRYEQGFTLIEMALIVFGLILLAVIAVPQYQEYVKKSRMAEAKVNLETIRQNQEVFKRDPNRGNGAFAGTLDDLGWELPEGGHKGPAPAQWDYTTNPIRSRAKAGNVEAVLEGELSLTHGGQWE